MVKQAHSINNLFNGGHESRMNFSRFADHGRYLFLRYLNHHLPTFQCKYCTVRILLYSNIDDHHSATC